ncbi:MAG: anthranilate synthase component II [Owenweeksia sp.]
MRVLLLDNYDSFTFNLFHYLQQITDDVVVKRNDELSVEQAMEFSHLLISPGPGLPKDAGITSELIQAALPGHSVLGVCLGCQALGEYFGGTLFNQEEVAHGIQRKVTRTNTSSWLLEGIPNDFQVGLYHSWAIDPKGLPSEIKITARSEKGVIMAMEHEELPVAGVQFHPESIMTEHGLKIIANWLER